MHCILHFVAMRLTNPGIFFTSLLLKPRLSQIDYIPAFIECPLPADFPLPTIVSISAAPCGAVNNALKLDKPEGIDDTVKKFTFVFS